MRTEVIARELGVHKSHLVRAFSNAVGMAPQTYMRQVRVAKSRELISEGSKLSEVALMLGFSDQAHLTREFKKVFGYLPACFRETSVDIDERTAPHTIESLCRISRSIGSFGLPRGAGRHPTCHANLVQYSKGDESVASA